MNVDDKIGVQIVVYGLVQGVSFRAFTKETAVALNISGSVMNLSNGNVKILAYGIASNINEFINHVKVGSKHSRVDHLDLTYLIYKDDLIDFKIIK